MSSDNIIFKKSWLLAIEGYASNVRCEFYEAVFTYLSCGRTVDLVSGGAKRAFASVKKDIDQDLAESDRQQHISEVRRAAQKKSVDARRAKKEGSFANFANANFANSDENPPSSHAHVIGDNKNNNQQDIEKEKLEKKERESKKRKNEKPEVPPENPPKDIVDVKAFIAYFNTELEKAKAVIPHNCSYTEKRDKAIHARVREHGRKSLQVMVEKAAKSDFLNGKNDRTFVAFLDWLLRPNNFVKVIEGNYDNNSIDNSKFKNNSNGNKQQYDRRRGVDAEKHRPEEY